MDTDRLADWFRTFAEIECPGLPLYSALCLGTAADQPLLELLLDASPGQWRPNLLLAALHDTVLAHPNDAFARHWPTVGGAFDPTHDPMPEARAFIDDHADRIRHLIATRSTQTNEVNRSCLWFAAVRLASMDLADRPIALIEVGASAGLNLRFDRYAYRFGDDPVRGDAASPVELACTVATGTPPLDAALPSIVHRVGLDRSPVDLTDPESRRWLKACIWPEQPERHARFDTAADLTTADPPTIVADDAVDGIGDLIDACPEDAHVIILNSWVMTYLPRPRRAAFDAVVDLAGSGRDITRISAEGEGVVDWVPRDPARDELETVVGLARWRDGRQHSERLATCAPHLAWMRWGQPSRLP